MKLFHFFDIFNIYFGLIINFDLEIIINKKYNIVY